MILKKRLKGTVSQKLECALIALSNFSSLYPKLVFVSLLCETTFRNKEKYRDKRYNTDKR